MVERADTMPVDGERTCVIRTLSTLVTALETWNADTAAVLATVGLAPDEIDDWERRITIDQYLTVWRAAREQTGDEAIGLHVLECFDLHDVQSNIVYIASSSATPRDAFERVSPFINYHHNGMRVELLEDEKRTVCRMDVSVWADERILVDYFLGLFVKIAPQVVGDATAREAWFRHAAPDYAAEYERVLQTPVRFDMPYDAVIGVRDDLDRPLPGADEVLCTLLERQATDALERMPRVSTFATSVREQIESLLGADDLTAERVATSLGLSARTLRRRLADEDVTYQSLLDSVRCARAREALARPGTSVGEVAFELGFSDTSAFHKAFRRWTGQRPSDVATSGRGES